MPDTKIAKTADCGHEYEGPKAGVGGAAGYARLGCKTEVPNVGTLRKGAKVCYACADAVQIAELADGRTQAFAYVSGDGKTITTWSGGTLMRILWMSRADVRYTPTGGRYERFYFDAKDVHGNLWHGIGPGNGMYCRMRLAKNQNN